MSLKARLDEDMKKALRAKEEGKTRLSVIRLVKAAIKNAEIDKRRELDDAGVIEVLAREVKQRREAILEFERVGRPDYAARLQEEIDILLDYLPQQLSEEEIRKLAQEAIAESGATSSQDLGKVMGILMPKVKGRADGKLVNQIVREMLK